MFELIFYLEKKGKTFSASFMNEKGFGSLDINQKKKDFQNNGYKIKKYTQIHREKKK